MTNALGGAHAYTTFSKKKMIIMTNTSKESNDPIAWLSDICVLNAEMAVE